MGRGEPSPWVWLREGADRLFHAVSVWALPPEEGGPVAVCGQRVQVVSLFDEPAGGRWGRDEQRPDVRRWGRVAAAAVGGGAAQ
jgi:hypothetical protein